MSLVCLSIVIVVPILAKMDAIGAVLATSLILNRASVKTQHAELNGAKIAVSQASEAVTNVKLDMTLTNYLVFAKAESAV